MESTTAVQNEETVVIGMVELIADPDFGRSLIISSDTEDYIVRLDKMGQNLMKHAGQYVEAVGRVRRYKSGAHHIVVSRFEVLVFDDEADFEAEDWL